MPKRCVACSEAFDTCGTPAALVRLGDSLHPLCDTCFEALEPDLYTELAERNVAIGV